MTSANDSEIISLFREKRRQGKSVSVVMIYFTVKLQL
jgi:hypothetical protein